VAAELYKQAISIINQSGVKQWTITHPDFLAQNPGIADQANYAHEHHLHVGVNSGVEYKYSDGVSAPSTSGSGGAPQICCPPGVTPGEVSNSSTSGGKLSQKVFDLVAKLEGGLVDNPNDTGGRTNGGVTQKTYDAYRKAKGLPTQAVDNLSAAEKREIYDQFYAVSKADRLKAPLSMAAFDTAINFGEAAMGTFLREILQNKPVNSIPDSELKILTDAEVEQLNSRDPKQVAIELLNRRLQFRDIRVQQDPSQRVFLAGWRARDNEVLAQIQSGAFDTASSTLLLPQEYAVNDDSKKNLPQNIFESIFTPIRAEALISGPAKDSGNEFSQLSKSHLEFMEWVAKEKKYPGPYADNGGPDPATKTAADKLIAQAKADGINLQIAGIAGNYGYRGYNAQTFLFLDKIPSNLRYQDSMGAPDQVPQNVKNAYLQRASLSAPVGYSEHHTGKAVDFISDDGVSANLDPNTYPTALANWLETNATKAGFKLSYPKNSTAGAGYEPWHWLFGSVTPSDPNSETGANVSVPGGCIVAGTSGVSAGTNGSTTGGLPSNGKGTLNSGIYDTDFLKKLADGILTRNTITGNDCYAIVAGNGSILEGLDPDMILQGLATSPFTKSAYMFHDFMQSSSEGVPNYVRYGYEYSNDTAKMQRGSIVVISGEINKERGGDGDINVFIGKEEMASRGYGGYDAWMGRPINDEAISDLILGIYTKIKK
jgi:lysozyme family protein